MAASGRKLIFSVLDPELQNPYTMNFQLNVQRSLTADLMLEVGYVGVRGVKFPLHRRFNLPDRVTGERPNPQLIPGGFFVDNSESTVYHSLRPPYGNVSPAVSLSTLITPMARRSLFQEGTSASTTGRT